MRSSGVAPVLPRDGVDQVDGIELAAAGVALVAARARFVAVRTLALDITIREEAPRFGIVEEVLRLGVEVVVLQQGVEQPVHHVAVVVGHGRGEGVERDAHPLPGVEDRLVELGHDLGRRAALVVSADGDRRAMRVGAGDHGDAVAADAVVAGEDVGGQIGAAELSVVDRTVGVGPGDADEDVVGHGSRLGVEAAWNVNVPD